jgi:glycosyltransferase involved in cell wall biosynthesis
MQPAMQPGSGVLIMPAYNEATALPKVLPAVTRAATGLELVVIDDGSRDDTAAVAAGLGARVIRHPHNLGYGASVQTGYKYALARGAAVLAQMDADGQHDPRQIPRLLDPILRGECDLVVGSRFLEPSGYEMDLARRIGRDLFRAFSRRAGIAISDPTSGFQAMNRRVLALYAEDFFPSDYPDVDVLVTAHREGLRIREVPVEMSAGLRPSSLHGGLRSLYYPYKMLLSLWAGSARARRPAAAPTSERPPA